VLCLAALTHLSFAREQRFVEFELEIDPPSLVSRIMSVREQIAREWVADLGTMVTANELILSSYYENLEMSRDDEECVDYHDEDEEDCISTEHLAAAYGGGGSGLDEGTSKKRAFDRSAVMLMSNSIASDDRGSSPYRKGNFDLLVLLATQESVHRVLREYREIGEERKVSFEWLRDFYVSRLPSFFDGDQEHGRADDFLEELLLTPPSMKTVDDTVELVDPMRIAEDIIRTRSEVGEDWKEIVKNVPAEHTELRKVLLARQMGAWPPREDAVTEDVESSADFASGAFD